MEPDRRREMVEEFLMFIGMMIRGMDTIFRRDMEKYQVTWPQFHLLKLIQARGRCTITELSNMLMIALPTTSRMIDGLCTKELLVKEKDPSDQRLTYVKLPPKSEELLGKLLELQDEVMYDVFKDEDLGELEKHLEALSRIAGRWLETAETRGPKGAG